MNNWIRPILLVAALSVALTNVHAESFGDVSLQVTDIKPGYIRNGLFLPVSNISQVEDGVGRLSKNQTMGLLGNPNDGASSIQDDSWFYNINLPLENSDYLVCQYRVYFSNQMVSGLEWRRPQCQARYAELLEPDVRSFSADLLFGFDSAEISTGGRNAIHQLSNEIIQSFNNPSIQVIGYTDRLGDPGYNLELSEQRARAVSIALVESGMPQRSLRYEGRGASDPVVFCDDAMPRPQLIACLAENRRVNIVLNEGI